MGNLITFAGGEPPRQYPSMEEAPDFGLIEGLRPWKTDHGSRCSNCCKLQRSGSWMVWIPDSIMRHDPAWAVTQTCKENRWNGCSSGWCIPCAQSFSPKLPKIKRTLLAWLGFTK